MTVYVDKDDTRIGLCILNFPLLQFKDDAVQT